MSLQETKSETLPTRQAEPMPDVVKIALRVILNHVEPGWENCVTLVSAWLDEQVEAQQG